MSGPLQRPKAALAWTLALVAAGLWVGARLPVEWVPTLELPTLSIAATWPGTSPRAVEQYVTAPMERALRGVPGTAEITSLSQENQAFLRLSVAAGVDLGLYAAEVSDRLAAIRAALPAGVVPHLTYEVPEALRDEQGFMTLQLVGAVSPLVLRRTAEELVAPRLRRVAGVALVTVEGGEEQELRITLDSDRATALGLTVEEVTSRLAAATTARSYGRLQGRGHQFLLWSTGHEQRADLAALVLRHEAARASPLRLEDVAAVAVGAAPVRSLARVDGKPVVSLRLDRTPDSDLLTTATAVSALVTELGAGLPGLELRVADDTSLDVRRELADLRLRGGVAVVLLSLVLGFLLRSARAALLVLLSVVSALALASVLLWFFDQSLNLLTLAGLAMLWGLLVDNGAVVVESLQARQPLRPLVAPLLGCTVTTVAVFLPMVYLSGDLRGLFGPFALLAAATLVFSLLTSLWILPSLAGFLPRSSARSARRRGALARAFLAAAALGRRYPRLTLAALALAIGLPTPLLPPFRQEPMDGWATPAEQAEAAHYNRTVGRAPIRWARQWLDPLVGGVTRPFLLHVERAEDWQTVERPELRVVLRLPTGSGIDRSNQLITPFERLALTSTATERTLTRVVEDVAMLRVRLRDAELQGPEPMALRNRLVAEALSTAGVLVAVSGLVPSGFVSGVGDASGFTIEAHGPTYEGLDQLAKQVAAALRRDSRVAEVDTDTGRNGQRTARDTLRVAWSPDAFTRTGLSAADLARVLRGRLEHPAPNFYAALEGVPRLPVRVATSAALQAELGALENTPLARPAGGTFRLRDHAVVAAERDPPQIERENQQYKRYLKAYYRGPERSGRELVDRTLAGLEVPPGFRVARPNPQFFGGEAERQLVWVLVAALGLVYLATAAALESWRLALWVLAAVPVGWIGVAGGFLALGEDFGQGALLGAVLTLGLAVNGGILLAASYQRVRTARPGLAPATAALLAFSHRLRPLWATTLTSVFGLVPMLVIPGAQPFWRGLAVTVIGGLLASTLLAPLAFVALAARSQRAKLG